MSYFYQHIKGLTSQNTKWKINCEAIDSSSGMTTPTILFTKSSQSEETLLGNIITSDMNNGIINNDFSFNRKVLNTKQIVFGDNDTSSFNNTEISTSSSNYIRYNDSKLKLYANVAFEAKSSNNVLTLDTSKLAFNGNISSIISFNTIKTTADGDALTQCPISFSIGTENNEKGFAIKTKTISQTTSPIVWFNTPIVCDVAIHALYFNATSDKRAKTNIEKATFSALDIINKLPIYNFKYKSDNSNSIGIIAQEALDIPAGNFDLVINPQASGENGDYMSVKESKLVYIAWKAIQEQQKIIDNQSKEIEELKQLVKTLIQK